MATSPDQYQDSFHTTLKGKIVISGDGKPINKEISLKQFKPDDLYSISPDHLWDSKITRTKSYIFDHYDPQPYDPKEDEKMILATQMAVKVMADKLSTIDMHTANYDVLNRVCEHLLSNPKERYTPIDSETMADLTDQLKQKETLSLSL